MIRKLALIVAATAAALTAAPAICSAQMSQEDESLQCNSIASCYRLVQYFTSKSSGAPQPLQEQYTVLTARAFLVGLMYQCVQVKHLEEFGTIRPAWELTAGSP